MAMKYLGSKSFKTEKGEKLGYKTLIMYLLPYKQNSFGKNICPNASAGCAAACLVGSGFGGMYKAVKAARLRKTDAFLFDQKAFMFQVKKDIENGVKTHSKNWEVVVRLNGTSDIPFENIRCFEDGKNIFELFPNVQFYDYTKSWKRFDKVLPSNYHLTFSRSENNHDIAMSLLERGINVAMVFKAKKLPLEYGGFEVINGDVNDLRFKDKKGEKGVIVGLKYKNLTGKGADNTQGIASGFVIDLTNPTPVLVRAMSCGK